MCTWLGTTKNLVGFQSFRLTLFVEQSNTAEKNNKKQRKRNRSQDKDGEKQKWKSSILWDGRAFCLSDHFFETLCLSFSLSHCNIYIWFDVLFSLSLFPHFILAYAALSFILLRLLLLSCSLTIYLARANWEIQRLLEQSSCRIAAQFPEIVNFCGFRITSISSGTNCPTFGRASPRGSISEFLGQFADDTWSSQSMCLAIFCYTHMKRSDAERVNVRVIVSLHRVLSTRGWHALLTTP